MKVSGQLQAPAALPTVPIGEEVGWAPEPVFTLWRKDKFYSCRNRVPAFQPTAPRYTDWTIPTPKLYLVHSVNDASWHPFNMLNSYKLCEYHFRNVFGGQVVRITAELSGFLTGMYYDIPSSIHTYVGIVLPFSNLLPFSQLIRRSCADEKSLLPNLRINLNFSFSCRSIELWSIAASYDSTIAVWYPAEAVDKLVFPRVHPGSSPKSIGNAFLGRAGLILKQTMGAAQIVFERAERCGVFIECGNRNADRKLYRDTCSKGETRTSQKECG
jgi:hypothetical protein